MQATNTSVQESRRDGRLGTIKTLKLLHDLKESLDNLADCTGEGRPMFPFLKMDILSLTREYNRRKEK